MELKIYTDRMKDGHTDLFEGDVSTASLLPKEPDLSFADTLHLSGEAYLAGDHLVVQLKAKTFAWMPCSICNAPVKIEITLPNLYHTEPLLDIKGGVFDLGELIREDLFLELPKFCECEGECPERASIQKYLKSPEKPNQSHEAHFPFSDL